MDPANPQVLHFGTRRLYRTGDNAETWAAIGPAFGGNLSAIAVAPSDTRTIYVGTSSGALQLTPNARTSLLPVTGGLPNRYVTDIVVDPSAAQHAYLTVSGFGTGHVFETVDGTTWQNISSSLVDEPVNALFRQPGTGALYISADLGVFDLLPERRRELRRAHCSGRRADRVLIM